MDSASPSVADLYLRRSPAEYSRAFDRAAATLEAAAGPALVVASSPTFAIEFLRRCHRPLDFAAVGTFAAPAFVDAARQWAAGPIRAVSLETGLGVYAACAWPEPDAGLATRIARTLASRARPGASLEVIAASYLSRWLPAWQALPPSASCRLSPGAAMTVLRANGWRIDETIAYHGPRAAAWARLGVLLEGLGRPNWADRARLAMWARYQEKGWLWPLAPLALIRAHLA